MFQQSRSHFKIPGARRVKLAKFQNEGPEVLGSTERYRFARATSRPGFAQVSLYWAPASWLYLPSTLPA